MKNVALLLLLLALPVNAQDKPRWMSPEAGWVDEASDARVEEVTRTEDGNYRVKISVPKVEKPIEEVVVVGTREEAPEVSLPVSYEVINDLDNDRSGIILYIGSKDPFALRINYHDGTQKAIPKDPGLTIR